MTIFSAAIGAAILISKGFVLDGSYQIPLLAVAMTVLVSQAIFVPGFTLFIDRKLFGEIPKT